MQNSQSLSNNIKGKRMSWTHVAMELCQTCIFSYRIKVNSRAQGFLRVVQRSLNEVKLCSITVLST